MGEGCSSEIADLVPLLMVVGVVGGLGNRSGRGAVDVSGVRSYAWDQVQCDNQSGLRV